MHRKFLSVLLIGALAGCADEPTAVSSELVDGPLAESGTPFIGGHVYGPNGQNICSYFPVGASLRVSSYGRNTSDELFSFTGGAWVDCSAGGTGKYAIYPAAKNEYVLMYRSQTADLGTVKIPDVWIDDRFIAITGYTAMDLRIAAGEEPYGRAVLDGAPVEGLTASLSIWPGPYPPGFYGIAVTSGADGRWYDAYGQVVTLQRNRGYTLTCPNMLASTKLEQFPSSPTYLVFPTENNVLKCSYTSETRAVNWSHYSNDLTMTMYPGYFGESSRPDWTGDDPGAGWGVMFHPGGAPDRFGHSEMFHGGLTISNQSQIISASNLGSFSFACDDYCQNEFAASSVGVTSDGSGRSVVEWTYEDNNTTSGVDLKVVQTSWQGLNGDYSIIRYLVRNTGASSTTLNVGWFMDWDVQTYNQNNGGVSRDGRLQYVYDASAGGPYMGSLIMRKGAAGNYFRVNAGGTGFTLQQQLDALAGTITNVSPTSSGDIWYLHSADAVTLGAGAASVIWMAIVGGESLAALEANADAAEAELEVIRTAL